MVVKRKKRSKKPGARPVFSEREVERITRAIAGKLVEARLESGMTQVAVARAVRLSPSLVSKIEHGERRLDPLELARFARLYGMSIVDFIEQEGT